MNTRAILHRRAALMLATGLLFAQRAAEACPGCKQAAGMGDGAKGSLTVNAVGIAYAASIGLLLCMVFGVICLIGYMGYRNCRIIAARQQAELAAEEDFGAAWPAGGRA